MHKERSFVLKPAEAKKKWHLIDAEGKVVGRLATLVASLLRGKGNPQWTPHTDSGDFVVVVNADKVKFTGRKWDNKIYYRHSGYVGGLKEQTARELAEGRPEEILIRAVRGMLPKSSLGRKQLTKLKVFAGGEHSCQAQRPVPYKTA